jgi:plasmid stabilization system protein ParE
MPNYELTEAAEADLKTTALYTISKWGPRQAARYGAILDSHFEDIGNGKSGKRQGAMWAGGHGSGLCHGR